MVARIRTQRWKSRKAILIEIGVPSDHKFFSPLKKIPVTISRQFLIPIDDSSLFCQTPKELIHFKKVPRPPSNMKSKQNSLHCGLFNVCIHRFKHIQNWGKIGNSRKTSVRKPRAPLANEPPLRPSLVEHAAFIIDKRHEN